MSNWTPDDVYDPKPRRRGPARLAKLALVVALAGGGGWWIANASPWADQVQARWAASEVGRQAAELRQRFRQSAVGRTFGYLWSLGTSAQRLARLAPADTRFYAEIAPSWWTRLAMYGPGMRPAGQDDGSLAESRRWLREQWGLDWDADVAPWIGMEFGALGRKATGGADGEGEFTVFVGSRDDAAARAFVQKLRTRRVVAGEVASEGAYGGTRYDVLTPAKEAPYALAVLAGYLVVATPPAALHAIIDQQAKGGPTLLDNPRYQRVAGAWSGGAVGHAFADLGAEPGRRKAIGDGLPPPVAMGGTIDAGADWTTLSVLTAFDVAGAPAEDRARWGALLPATDLSRFDRLPAATVVAIGATATPALGEWLSGPLGAGWAPMGGGLGEGMAFTALTSALKTVRGPFAVGIAAVSAEVETEHPVGAVLALRPEEPDALEAELDRAAQALVAPHDPARLPGPIGEWAAVPWVRAMLPKSAELAAETHRGEPWKVLKAAGQGLAGWTRDGDQVLLAGGAEALKLCQAEDFKPISASPEFAAVRRRLPREAAAYVYFDGANGRALLDGSWLPAKYAAQAKRAMRPLRAVGAAAAPGLDGQGFHHAALTFSFTP